ncbi:heat shock protein beta-11-like [Megalops cyprinoides]|uniref:heat shock protein beta-11-like n=1 Tax=Megalops cyprinoides TaxID=118141 RepID=UPI001865642A|nr:heat shock protein beta-11-like [Megalops cyprinoides]
MLCPRVFQASYNPLMDFHWPVRSLWPETRPLFFQMEQEMMRHMQEIKHSLEYMEQLHRKIFEEIDPLPPSVVFQPITFKMDKEGDRFALTLDTKDFAPEELSVKQVGRKLRVSGKNEKKQEDGKGSFSYKRQEFRQEFDLPEGVNPEAVTCSLLDGQLQIQAPREALPGATERVVPIDCVPSAKTPQALSSESENSVDAKDSSKN